MFLWGGGGRGHTLTLFFGWMFAPAASETNQDIVCKSVSGTVSSSWGIGNNSERCGHDHESGGEVVRSPPGCEL